MTGLARSTVPGFNLGRTAAATGASWTTCPYQRQSDRRLWLAGWLYYVSCAASTPNGLAPFHAKQLRDGADWLPVERELLEIGRRQAPRVTYHVLAAVLGRSDLSCRIAASRHQLLTQGTA